MQVNIRAVVFAISLQSMCFYIPLEDPILISIFNRNADSYHTLYCLAGLSSAQHHLYPSATRRSRLQDAWEPQPGMSEASSSVTKIDIILQTIDDGLRKAVFTELLSWTEEEGVSKFVGGEANRLVYLTIHSFSLSFI